MKYKDVQREFINLYAATKEVTIQNEVFQFCFNRLNNKREHFFIYETDLAFKHFILGYKAAGGTIE